MSEMTHKQALNRMKDITEEIERLDGRDSLSPEDETYWAELVREFETLDGHRKHLERKADISKVRSVLTVSGRVESGTPHDKADGYDLDPILNPDSVEDQRFRNPWDLSEVRTFARGREEVSAELRSRALSAIEKMSGASDSVREAGTHIVERFDDGDAKIARMVLATSSPEYLRAWCKLARGKGHMITPVEQAALTRAMTLTDNAGGYLVPFQLDPTVIITSDGSRNDIRQIARQVVATGDVWNGVSSGAVSWSWAAESAEVADGATTFAQPTVPVYKADGFVPITIEALEDEANVTAEVASLLAFGKDTLEAAAFATGSGSGQPTGIITALAGGSSEVDSATTDTFAVADVYALDDALPARYRRGASWLANRKTYNAVRQFDTTNGNALWQRIGAGQPAELMGRPVYESEDMDGVVDASSENRILLYGDFSNYVIADRVGMSIEFIPHLMGSSQRPKGQRGWYAYYRVGADSVNDGAFRLLNVT